MKTILYVSIGSMIALVIGSMLNFYPFLGSDLIVREIQYCTFLICVIIAICTHLIKSK